MKYELENDGVLLRLNIGENCLMVSRKVYTLVMCVQRFGKNIDGGRGS